MSTRHGTALRRVATADELARAVKAHGADGAARALRRYGLIAPIAGASGIAIDNSTPAATHLTTAATTLASSSITPPANSLVVIAVGTAATGTNTASNITGVSDGTNSYSNPAFAFQTSSCAVGIFWHFYASAPGATTATASFSGTGPAQGALLVPIVLTGCASTQNGAVATHGAGALESTSSAPTVTVDATATGSLILAMQTNFTSSASPTISGDQSITFNTHSSFLTTSGNGFWAQWEPTLTSGAGNVTISDTAPTGLTIAMCAVEILAAAGAAALPPRPVTWPQAMWRSAYR